MINLIYSLYDDMSTGYYYSWRGALFIHLHSQINLYLKRSRGFPVGKLGDHKGGEHDDASGDFPGRHGFTEEEAAAYCGEDRFQAHDYRCQSRRGVFLPYDLEGKGDAHFQDGDVQYRYGAVEDRLELYGFGKKRGDAGEYACQHEHHEGKLHRVDSFRKIVDYQYLERVSYGTAQYEAVPQL